MEIGDKYLNIHIWFKLPKDFNGDLNNALEEVIKYRRGPKNHDKIYGSKRIQRIFN